MQELDTNLYSKVMDRHGAVANIYFNPNDSHHVIYIDPNGARFYHEEFDKTSIETVEESVIDWANGRRELL